MLSVEDLRRWCRAHTRRGQGKYRQEYDREFATMEFLRVIDMDHRFFYRWVNGQDQLPARYARLIRRFVEDWEAGLLEFAPGRRRELVRRTTPRPTRVRMTLDLDLAAGPRLRLLPKLQPTRMPSFPDVTGVLDGKRGRG